MKGERKLIDLLVNKYGAVITHGSQYGLKCGIGDFLAAVDEFVVGMRLKARPALYDYLVAHESDIFF